MGNPVKDSPAYLKKLEQTRKVKQVAAFKKLTKDPRVRSIVRAVRQKDAAKWAEEREDLEEKLRANTMFAAVT